MPTAQTIIAYLKHEQAISYSFTFILAIITYHVFPLVVLALATSIITGLLLALVVSGVLRGYRNCFIILAAITFIFSVGIFRAENAYRRIEFSKQIESISRIGYSGTVVSLEKRVGSTIAHVQERSGQSIIAYLAADSEISLGDIVSLKGNVEIPEPYQELRFKKDNIFASMRFPEVEVTAKAPPSLRLLLARFRDSTISKLKNAIPETSSPLLIAILANDETGFTPQLKEDLSRTGLRHITAVSGSHITIIGAILVAVFLGSGLWRRSALILSLAFLIFYILAIGAPASAARAGIMGGIGAIALLVGVPASGIRLLIYTTAAMVFYSPLLLFYDVGFQLSVLAVAGLILLTPRIERVVFFIPNWFGIRLVVASSTAAYLVTAPLIAAKFHSLSILSPLANILVVPFMGPLLFFGVLGVIALSIHPFLGSIILYPAHVMSIYTIEIMEIISRISWASIDVEVANYIVIIAYYFVLLLIVRKDLTTAAQVI